MQVLLLNCFSRNSLAVINGLGLSCRVIGGVDSTPFKRKLSKWLSSSKVVDVAQVANPVQGIDAFKMDVLSAVHAHGIDVIIATGTATTDALSQCKAEIEAQSGVKVLVEDFDKLKLMTDKWDINGIAERLGITAPATLLLRDPARICETAEEGSLSFPYLIKPRRSYASIGVEIFKSQLAVTEYYAKMAQDGVDIEPDAYILQEVIDGPLHDVTSCSREGVVLSALSQERLLTWHDFGGGGIINRTTDEKDPIKAVSKIIADVKWNGIAEFDFIKGGDGRFYLLECNPKFWGTTQLTIDAGMNMPRQLVEFWQEGKDVAPISDYEVGLVYKWIFPECIAHWFNRPFSLANMLRRFAATVKSYEGTRTLTNLSVKNWKHLLGIVVNKSMP